MTAPGRAARPRGRTARPLGPLATAAGQVAVGGTLVVLFGALFETLPPGVDLLLLAPAALCLLLAPPGRLGALHVPLPLVALLVWAALSWTWSVDPVATLEAVRGELLLVALLAPVAGLLSRRALAGAVLWTVRLVLLAVVLTLLTRPETRVSGSAEFLVEGWRGSFPDKNSLALFLTAALAAVLALDRGGARVASVGVIAVLHVGAQSATGSTGALLVLLVAVWLRLLGRRPARQVAVLVLATATTVTAFVALVISNVQTVLQVYGRDADLTGRTEIWAAVLDALAERPLLGFGLDALLDLQRPTPVTQDLWAAIGFRAVHAHNGALDLAGQIGAVGLALHLLVVLQTAALAVRRARRGDDVATWALLLLPAIALMSGTEPVLLGPWLALLVLLQVPLLQTVRGRAPGSATGAGEGRLRPPLGDGGRAASAT